MSKHHGRQLNWHPGRQSSLDAFHRPTPLLLSAPMVLQDMEAACPPVYDQGQEGSCTANAVTGAFQIKEHIEGRGVDPGPASRQAVYYWARRRVGNQAIDSGSTISDTMWAALTYGLPLESLWTYDMPIDEEPPAEVYADGLKRRPTGKMIARVRQDLPNLYATLAGNDPIPCGFTVYTSFMDQAMASSGIWHGIQPGDQVEGGHAVCMVGYNPVTRMFKFRNSWGANWGIRGYFWMPESIVLGPDFSDFIAAVDAPKAAA
jgi:hypothetical protein